MFAESWVTPELLADVAERARASAPRPVVLVDGGSGAGKTTFARALRPRLDSDAGPAQLVSLDDLYPGWDGLAAGSAAVHETILRHVDPGWRAWDWTAGRPGDWRPVDPSRPLVVEGCGSLSRENRALATFGIWIDLDADERRRRALRRDGDLYEPHWDRWAAHEEAFRALESPLPLADVVLDAA